MPRWPKKVEEVEVPEPIVESKIEETPKTVVDAMPSEIPVVVPSPYADARKHFVGKGSVSGEWLFDDVPGSITATTYEEALKKYQETPGIYKVAGSH